MVEKDFYDIIFRIGVHQNSGELIVMLKERLQQSRSEKRHVMIVVASFSCLIATSAWGAPLEHGTGLSGQPGVNRTLSGVPSIPGSWVITANGTYGWQPDVIDDGDVVHRTAGRLALAYAPWSFFEVGVSLDQSVALYNGSDDEVGGLVAGAVGDPRINFRTGFDLGHGFSLGAQASIWFPSGMGSFSFSGGSISPFIDGAVSFTPERIPLGVHLQLGYHHNRTGVFLDEVTGFTEESLVLSGVTISMHHLAVGLGVEYRLGPVAPFVEFNTDLPLDNGGMDHVLLLVGLGARMWLGPQDAVQLLAAFEFSTLQSDYVPDPLQNEVYETRPLLGVFLGLTVRLPVRSIEGARDADDLDESVDGTSGESAAAEQLGRIAGRVLCGNEPCGGSTTVEIVDSGASPFFVNEEDGTFTTSGLAPGHYQVIARVQGVDSQTQEVQLAPGATSDMDFSFAAASTTGIRGRVTDFQGMAVQAQIRIPELELELESDEQGQFSIEAPPGQYQVMIWAEGYVTQTTQIEVTRGGMVVMNVELRSRGHRGDRQRQRRR